MDAYWPSTGEHRRGPPASQRGPLLGSAGLERLGGERAGAPKEGSSRGPATAQGKEAAAPQAAGRPRMGAGGGQVLGPLTCGRKGQGRPARSHSRPCRSREESRPTGGRRGGSDDPQEASAQSAASRRARPRAPLTYRRRRPRGPRVRTRARTSARAQARSRPRPLVRGPAPSPAAPPPGVCGGWSGAAPGLGVGAVSQNSLRVSESVRSAETRRVCSAAFPASGNLGRNQKVFPLPPHQPGGKHPGRPPIQPSSGPGWSAGI